MNIGRRFFTESLVVRLGVALGTIVTLALAATISATVFTELSGGMAGAINMAGSLRMQTNWIAVQMLRAGSDGQSPSEPARAIAEFEKRLTSPQIMRGIPSDPNHPTRRAYDSISSQWSEKIKPAVLRLQSAPLAERDAFVPEIAAYVLHIDRLVYLLDHDLERRIQTLKVIQGTTLFLTIAVMLLAFYLLHSQVIVPLRNLLQCARRVRAGDFSVRARYTGEDELGQLGQSFNFMVADLARSYAKLEARVEEKTEQLARSNASLEVLYNTTRRLAENALSHATIEEVMGDIERAIGIEVSAICAREENDPRGFPIVRRAHGSQPDACAPHEQCAACLGNGQAGVHVVGRGPARCLSVPLTEAGKPYGVMLMRMPPGMTLEDWKLKLVESIGHHIGAALAAAKRNEEKGRIALMEERSVIARELHDSLAQSLSYLKIQVTRLRSHINAANGRGRSGVPAAEQVEQVNDVVEELKLGLNNAYRQLRELLTTFRLGMDGRGLSDALQKTIREFSRRTATEFRLHNRLLGHELNSSEQIHVLQVVREALTNVEHHARAQHADVRLVIEQGCVRVTVEDDGVGIPADKPPEHHYGLAIMHDRAVTLGGRMTIMRRPEGGTRVELAFAPRGPYHAGEPRTPHRDIDPPHTGADLSRRPVLGATPA